MNVGAVDEGSRDGALDAEALAIHARAVPRPPDVYRALGAATAEISDTAAFLFYEQALEVCRDHGFPRSKQP